MKSLCLFAALTCFFFSPAFAAFKSANDEVALDKACNPAPLADDITLPMPCGLEMAFRVVDVPAGALINDKTFPMGITNAANDGRQLYERQFYGHIAAPFTKRDLPGEWREKLPEVSARDEAFYFIGKYEVSRLQWQSVMDALNDEGEENTQACPKSKPGENLPITGISWFDAQNFLNRYNAWLVKNHAQSLPAFAGTQNIAFLRLPTEEEWEYAARGGARVPPEWWAEKDIFPLAEDKRLRDYGVYHSDAVLNGPAPIGSRNANPLGIHDTIGNVSEMVDGFFRLSIADMRNGQVERRLHGAAGGILAKGGSFRSEEDAVAPGWRDEVPLYTAKGPGRSSDIGLRLVLAGLNIPNAQRLDLLRNEEKRIVAAPEKNVKAPAVDITKTSTPLEALDVIIATADENMKSSLARLRSLMEDRENAEERLSARNVEQSFRSLLYQSETLRAFALRYLSASKEIEKLESLLKQPMEKSLRSKVETALKEAKGDLADYLHSLQMGASYYKNGLLDLRSRSSEEIGRLVAQARREYGGEGVFNEHMRKNIDELEKNLELVVKKGPSVINQQSVLKGILPQKHYQALPISQK